MYMVRIRKKSNYKNQKCIELPRTDLEHLTVKVALYTLNRYP